MKFTSKLIALMLAERLHGQSRIELVGFTAGAAQMPFTNKLVFGSPVESLQFLLQFRGQLLPQDERMHRCDVPNITAPQKYGRLQII